MFVVLSIIFDNPEGMLFLARLNQYPQAEFDRNLVFPITELPAETVI